VYHNGIASKKWQSPVGYEAVFLKRSENVWFTCFKNIYFVGSRSTLCIAMELFKKNGRVLWATTQWFWNVEKTFVLPFPKTSTLLGVGVRCVSQWDCFKETAESCGLRDNVETQRKRLIYLFQKHLLCWE